MLFVVRCHYLLAVDVYRLSGVVCWLLCVVYCLSLLFIISCLVLAIVCCLLCCSWVLLCVVR